MGEMRQVFEMAAFEGGLDDRGERPLDPERILTISGCVGYAWDLATDRLSWGPNLRGVFALDRRHRLSSGRAYAALVLPGSGDSRDDTILASGETDTGSGVAFRCRYVVAAGAQRFVVEDCGHWFAGPDGRPAFAEGIVRAAALGRRTAEPDGARPEPARERLLRQLTTLLHDPNSGRQRLTVMVGALERQESDGTTSAPTEAEAAQAEARLNRRLRRPDVMIPLSPTRFAFLLTSCSQEQALASARGIAHIVASRGLLGGSSPLTLRLGCVSPGERNGDAAALLERAEEAVERARAQNVPAMQLPPRLRRRPVRRPKQLSPIDLVAALNGRAVRLERRPLHELGTLGNGSFELVQPELARADGRHVHAATLAPLADRLGLSPLLDHRMLEQTLQLLRAEPQLHAVMPISAATLAGPGWLATLSAYLGCHRDIADRLIVAVNERAFARDRREGDETTGPILLPAALLTMKALGIGIAITGYGTGEIGLPELAELHVDLVVLNGALSDDAASVGASRFVVRSLLAGTRHLGLPMFVRGEGRREAARAPLESARAQHG